MISSIIMEGTKVDIRMVSQVERAQTTGEEVTTYASQVYEMMDDGEMEMIMPTQGGRLVLLPLNIRLEFVFYTKQGLYRSIGQIKERYKTDNRYLIKIELNTQLSKYQRREFYRLECILDMKYMKITPEQAKLSDEEHILDELRDDNFYSNQKKAIIVDISGGGARFVSEEELEENGYILMIVSLDNGIEERQYYLVARVIQSSRKDVKEVKFENRVEFVIKNTKIREEIIKFIFTEERRTRKHEKG